MTQSIEKSFLIDPLTTNNAIYRDSLTIKLLNSGIGKNLLWRAINLPIPLSLKNVVILCETNNIFTHSSTDIADCVVKIGYCLREKFSNINVFIHGLIPRDRSWSVNKVLIKDVNNNDLSLFLRDSLHLFN